MNPNAACAGAARGVLFLSLIVMATVALPACGAAPMGDAHGPSAGVYRGTIQTDMAKAEAPQSVAANMASPGEANGAASGRMPARHDLPDADRTADVGDNSTRPESPHGSTAPAADAPARKEFPESMLVEPMLITDANGKVTIGVERMPDSITTWKVRAIGHSIDGAFGEGSGTFRVFKDIFLNLQLPRVLTVGDELYVPLTVMNYSGATIDVDVAIQRETWLELDADGSYSFAVDPKSANKQYARVRIVEP
ncbi:MAG: alpha-2-macroglobulin family protein, partial [Planctomycetota bacterium]